MVSRSTWLHLRIPFSFFLMPVYFFALGLAPDFSNTHLVASFLIIHLLLYPASNGYNSYFDKDEKSIGGLKNPPPVLTELYTVSLLLDAIAVIAGIFVVSLTFGTMLFIYGIVSKMYSHPSVRIKKYAIGGWLITGLFQGFFTFVMCFIGITGGALSLAFQPPVLLAGILTSVMLWGNYPMTQVYQHEEDEKHGDRTMSRLLGIRGTFIFVQIVFAIAAAGFVFYFNTFFSIYYGYVFLGVLFPVVAYFMYWMLLVWQDERKADFQHTMLLNFISAGCLNGFFLYFFLENRFFSLGF